MNVKRNKKRVSQSAQTLCPVCRKLVTLLADMKTIRKHGRRNNPCSGGTS